MNRNCKLLHLLPIFTLLHFYGHTQAYRTADFYRATKIGDVGRPRGLFLDTSGDILVVSESASAIWALTETKIGTYTDTLIVDTPPTIALSHSVIHQDGYLYASSATTVYRWPYVAGSHELGTTQPEVVIAGMPTGGHFTRTLIFDSNGKLYVTVGSDKNVDENSERARIRRFQLDPTIFPIDFNTGEIFADGTRNTVGIGFDAQGDLWGVECGVDFINRPDLNITYNGNPAEELNRFLADNLGAHYGYPWCFSTDEHQVFPKGTQFAQDLVPANGIHTDAWCKNIQNNLPPILAMPAHQAPLGIEFYGGQGCGEVEGAFPCEFIGDAFVAFHGSWNSDIPVGYRVARLPFTKSGYHLPTGEIINIIYEPDTIACGSNCIRPVNAIFDRKGHLIISIDNRNEIIRVTYNPNVKGSAAQHGLTTMLFVTILFQFFGELVCKYFE